MDITSPRLLKLKGALFLFLGLLAAALLLWPEFDPRRFVLLGIAVWAFCRAYYFCFYVLEHYADPNFRYAGLWHALRHLLTRQRR
jgi:hypothetical protein